MPFLSLLGGKKSLTQTRPKQEPQLEEEGRSWDVIAEVWGPITPRVNRGLIAQGFLPLSPENVLAVVVVAEDAIRGQFPEHDTESREWWSAALEDADVDDPCPDPWRCQHCGEPWHVNHPEFKRPPALQAYVTDLRKRQDVVSANG